MNLISNIRSSILVAKSVESTPVLKIATRSFGYLISLGRLPIGLYGLFTASFLNESTIFGSIGACLLVPADFGGSLVFFERIGLITLAANFAIYVAAAYIAAYIPIVIDSISILTSDEKNLTIKRQAVLNLANAVSQIALATFVIIGYSHPTLIVPLMLIAGLFGSLSFLYKQAVLLKEKRIA